MDHAQEGAKDNRVNAHGDRHAFSEKPLSQLFRQLARRSALRSPDGVAVREDRGTEIRSEEILGLPLVLAQCTRPIGCILLDDLGQHIRLQKRLSAATTIQRVRAPGCVTNQEESVYDGTLLIE